MLGGLSEALAHGSRRGLRVQLLGVLLVALLPLLILSSIQGILEYEQQREREIERLYATALTASEAVSTALSRADGMTGAIAVQAYFLMENPDTCTLALQRMADADVTISNIAILDAQGRLVCSAVPPSRPDEDFSSRDWFADLRDGADRAHTGLVFGMMSRRQIVLSVRRMRSPVAMETGEPDVFYGAVGVATDIIAAASLVRRERLRSDAEIALVSREGTLKLSHNHRSNTVFENVDSAALLSHVQSDQAVRLEGRGVQSGYELILTSLVPDRLAVAVAAPARVFQSWSGVSVISTIAIPALMTLLVLVCVWVAVDYFILRWLTYLQRIARFYAAGHLDMVPQKARSAPREVARLGAVMEQMAASLAEQRKELAEAVDQRSGLLREIHHRVKNNLQVIVSLLNLQSRRISDPSAAEALMDARRRINALALVHRSLYETDDLRYVEARPFLKDLVQNLDQVLGGRDSRIHIEVTCNDLALCPDQAAPMALFVTEAVTNAFKHAFKGRSTGLISVRLSCDDEQDCVVAVSDDGVGAPEGAGAGTGSSLMHAFAQQLGGSFEVRNVSHGGHEAVIRFPVNRVR